MHKPPTSHNFFPDIDAERTRHEVDNWPRPSPGVGSKEYADAERYRIIVALAVREDRFKCKAEFDAAVRLAPMTVEQADCLISLTSTRPGCRAFQYGQMMRCECGQAWKASLENGPPCLEIS